LAPEVVARRRAAMMNGFSGRQGKLLAMFAAAQHDRQSPGLEPRRFGAGLAAVGSDMRTRETLGF
jgi:hypothetical protein